MCQARLARMHVVIYHSRQKQTVYAFGGSQFFLFGDAGYDAVLYNDVCPADMPVVDVGYVVETC